jgi:hypothetical protein
MTTLIMIGVDLVAITILTFGLYFRRHHRRDLLTAFLGVNVGVLAVSVILAGTEVGLGIGLGLFGVLSIIRLRSSEISQREVAYYFAALAMGLIAGLTSELTWVPIALLALLVAVMFVADHPRVLGGHRHQTMLLDTAYTSEQELVAALERDGRMRVTGVIVQHVDLVNDTTLVDVRYTLGAASSQAAELLERDSALAGAR